MNDQITYLYCNASSIASCSLIDVIFAKITSCVYNKSLYAQDTYSDCTTNTRIGGRATKWAIRKRFPLEMYLDNFADAREISQQELAEQVGVHRNTIGGWERGDYLPAHVDVLAIIKALNLEGGEKDEFLRSRYEYGRAETPSASSFSDFPHPRNLFFTGRDNALASLHALFTVNKPRHSRNP